MKISDQKLRNDRLVFYAKDVERLDAELDGFLEFSKAKCVMLVDREGHMVTRRGETVTESQESLAALIAGSFAATRETARLLGEEQFAALSHQGDRHSIQLSTVGPRTLLAIVWDERTNLGLIRFYAQETARRLEEIFTDIMGRDPGADPDDALQDGYSEQATAALDDLF
ncbi:MAG: putative regulator of Ras-like GTPase activity (Roadblock/LC7/MglB family) [Chlamydiales bacterium]|jgi:predicted regulator of Ras-like GTPase activity (Roadblock/LC7/MglB family)